MTDEEIREAFQGCLHNDRYNKKCSECLFGTATSQCVDDLKDSVVELIDRNQFYQIARWLEELSALRKEREAINEM